MTEEQKTVNSTEQTEQQAPKKEKAKKAKTTKQDKEIAALREELAAQKDQMLRTLAEYDNYRKRTQKEKDARYGDGIVYAAKCMLPVIDNLERALASTAEDSPLKEGVSMIMTQMLQELQNMGVTQFGEVGDEFDPNRHAAVMHVEDENLPESSLAEILQKGYVYKDGQIVRHAAVKVAN
ncbi:MAG: nucleotide exchange factor GrpE [Clostridia bacterium]|nr:nucleotide exchange factor GrpE [Clostridia bacterium]